MTARARKDGMRGLTVLLALVAIGFAAVHREVAGMFEESVSNPESAHALAAPILAALLAWRWRDEAYECAGRGSAWGVAIVATGVLMALLAEWPFNYGSVRRLSLVPIVAGSIVAVGGMRMLRALAPALLIVMIALPLGSRLYARAVILPETVTISAAAAMLDAVTWADVQRWGPDLHFATAGGDGWIALGQSYRGASMLLAMTMIVAFVAGAERRTFAGYAAFAAAAVPIVLCCNAIRLVLQGLMVIVALPDPSSAWPRHAANVAAIAVSYMAAAGVGWLAGGSPPARTGGREESPPRGRTSLGPAVACAVILAAMATTGTRWAESMAARFGKQPAYLRHPLDRFDESLLAGFTPMEVDPAAKKSLRESDVGTDAVLYRWMRPRGEPAIGQDDGRLELFVTYYSNPRDQIPHTPEVCARQAGATVLRIGRESLTLTGGDGTSKTVELTLVMTELSGTEIVTLYCFCCEGRFHPDRESTRLCLAMPGNARTYFAKIEATARCTAGRDASSATSLLLRLLAEAIPILEREHLPTDDQLCR